MGVHDICRRLFGGVGGDFAFLEFGRVGVVQVGEDTAKAGEDMRDHIWRVVDVADETDDWFGVFGNASAVV